MKDTVIIGGGPAGMTAAVYAACAGLSTYLIEKALCGGQMAGSHMIENYPGEQTVSGAALSEKMRRHVEENGIAVTGDTILEVRRTDGGFVALGEVGEYPAKTVIVANGAKRRRLGVPGEAAFLGRGVSYCATCDGALFKERDVAVVGGGASAVGEALYLSGICRTVFLVHRHDEFGAVEKSLDAARRREKIKFLTPFEVTRITGDGRVRGAENKHVSTGDVKTLDVSGVFVSIGLVPDNGFLSGLVSLTDDGYIDAGEDCRTGTDGIFAAGDTRRKGLRQIVTACADGAAAASAAAEFIRRA